MTHKAAILNFEATILNPEPAVVQLTMHHEPERKGSLKIRKVWLLESDIMGLQVSRHRI